MKDVRRASQTLIESGTFSFYADGQGLDHQEATINVRCLRVETTEDHPLDPSGVASNHGHSNPRRTFLGETVDASTDGWERDTRKPSR